MARLIPLLQVRFWYVLATTLIASQAHAQSLPQGLTCGLSYWDDDGIFDNNSCNGVRTVGLDVAEYLCEDILTTYCSGCNCVGPCLPRALGGSECWALGLFYGRHAASGYDNVFDGDFGNRSERGYYHQELASGVIDPSQASSFVLPQGAICGFHHTRNSPGRTCMGYDAANYFGLRQDGPAPGIAGCPPGWAPKKAFDMSSDYGHWTWCEYQDPNHLSWGQPSVQPLGIACGASHNNPQTGTVGQCMGYTTLTSSERSFCPSNFGDTGWIDMGEPARRGLGFCTLTSNPLPPPYTPPPPTCSPQCGTYPDCYPCPRECPPGTWDCCHDGSVCCSIGVSCP